MSDERDYSIATHREALERRADSEDDHLLICEILVERDRLKAALVEIADPNCIRVSSVFRQIATKALTT